MSKRSVSMRGGVSFLMRDADGSGDGDTAYYDDMVPLNYKSGQTKFYMKRKKGSGASLSSSLTGSASLSCQPMSEGEREIIKGPNGPILVTKVAGSFYAVDATCPHLNLPMKKGKISVKDGQPTLTCNFHNSCFEMKTGRCTQWVGLPISTRVST